MAPLGTPDPGRGFARGHIGREPAVITSLISPGYRWISAGRRASVSGGRVRTDGSEGALMDRLHRVPMARACDIPAADASTRSPASATVASIVADQLDGGQAMASPTPMATRSAAVPANAYRWPRAGKKATCSGPCRALWAACETTARHTRLPIQIEAERICTAMTGALVFTVVVSPSLSRCLVRSGSERHPLFIQV